MHPRRILAFVVTLGIFAVVRADDPPKGQDVKSPDDLRAFVEKAVAPLIKEQAGIGVVVGVWVDEKQQVFGFGKVKLAEQEVAPDGDTMFEIASMTKAFTGTLLGDLVNKGEMRLDDPAQKYLPAELQLPRRDDRDITLLNLATHTSSLPPQPPGIGLFAMTKPAGATNPYKHYMPADLAKTLKGIKLKMPIGSEEAYSNLGAGILGIALAGTAKSPSYEKLLDDRIARPLGMTQTRVTLSDDDRAKRLAPGHNVDGESASTWDFGCLEACGGVRSTVNDMLKFGKAALALDDKQPLTAAFKTAQQPWRELKGGKKLYTGLHWVRMPSPNTQNTLIWHNGQTGGYHSYLGLIPERKLVVVLLTNVARNADPVAISILKQLEQNEK
jgi:serine-type D-Ala-D-Ala carboxypeptidase/endopeptidase